MKIALILGNGFDIKIGIDTRYTDFYSFFLTQEAVKRPINVNGGIATTNHPELVKMIQNSSSKYWSDLELLLGNSIRGFGSVDIIRREKSYLEEQINSYLCKQQSRVQIDRNRQSELRSQLDSTITNFTNICNYDDENNFYDVEFITFNYTDVIDRIVESANINEHSNIVYHKPYHIHGTIDQTVIFGVDNEKQYIYPTNSRGEIEELKTIMQKTALNSMLRSNEVYNIKKVIHNMDAIIIYGASIGETDATWWKTISEWLFMGSGHRVSIIGYVDSSYPSSATNQVQIIEYENQFRRFMSSKYKGQERKNMVETYRNEEWMFGFSPSVVCVKPRGAFDNLIVE